jgi:hypothetical protein
VSESLAAEAFWWGAGAGGERADFMERHAIRRDSAAFPGPLSWPRVAVTLAPDRATVDTDGRELGAVRADELLGLGRGFGRLGWLPG